MLPSTIFKSLLKQFKEYIKVIPLTEDMQHMPEYKNPYAASNRLV